MHHGIKKVEAGRNLRSEGDLPARVQARALANLPRDPVHHWQTGRVHQAGAPDKPQLQTEKSVALTPAREKRPARDSACQDHFCRARRARELGRPARFFERR